MARCDMVQVVQGLAHAHEHQGRPSGSWAGPRARIRAITWPTISPAERLRRMPMAPVAQKVQPMAQPTWLLMHRVTRGLRTSRGMCTASMRSPSARPSTTLVDAVVGGVGLQHPGRAAVAVALEPGPGRLAQGRRGVLPGPGALEPGEQPVPAGPARPGAPGPRGSQPKADGSPAPSGAAAVPGVRGGFDMDSVYDGSVPG